jgi:hypothetical protein
MSGNSSVSLANALQNQQEQLSQQSQPKQSSNLLNKAQSDVKSDSILTVLPTELQITNDHVKKVIVSIQSIMNGKPLTRSNILTVVANVYSIANSMVDLTPRLRQTVIINALENIVDQQDLTEEETAVLNFMVQEVVVKFLSILTDIKNGDVKLHLPSCDQCTSCCSIN